MNRMASVLVGGVTAAVSGAVIAAAAVGQGVFDSPSRPAPKQTEAVASTWTTDATAAATAVQQQATADQQPVQPRIVYVDKDPVVMVRTVQQPVVDSSALSTETPAATPTNTAPATPSAPVTKNQPPATPVIQSPPPQAPAMQPPIVQSQPRGDDTRRTQPTQPPQMTAPTQAPPTSASHEDDDHHSSSGNTRTGGQSGHDD